MGMLAHLLALRPVLVGIVCAQCSGPGQRDHWSPALRLPVGLWVGWPTGRQGEPKIATFSPCRFHLIVSDLLCVPGLHIVCVCISDR